MTAVCVALIARVPVASVVMMLTILVAGALAALGTAFRPAKVRAAGASASTPSALSGLGGQRLAVGAVTGFVVLLASRWILLAVAAAVLTIGWGRILRDSRADDERRRIEGIAKWLEDLRDTLRGSSIGAEEALEQVARHPPEVLSEPMTMYLLRRRQGFRTEQALGDLAEALAHPTADAAIAALRLVVGGTASAGRLFNTVSALASAARDEVRARERVDRTRAIYQSSMKRLVVIGAFLITYLRYAAGDLLAPYGSPAGQAFLALPLAMWGCCIMWLRRLCRYELPQRQRADDDDPAPHRPAVATGAGR